MAPRLGYLVFEQGDPSRAFSPYIHLPAWVQAEKGGWLSFHFVSFNVYPLRYRAGSPSVPPPTPHDFEWVPQWFDIRTRGRFFDFFLVRSKTPPQRLFMVDPSIRLVDHRGTWWLFQREGQPRPAPPSPP
jgi:hypothetical protein